MDRHRLRGLGRFHSLAACPSDATRCGLFVSNCSNGLVGTSSSSLDTAISLRTHFADMERSRSIATGSLLLGNRTSPGSSSMDIEKGLPERSSIGLYAFT